MTEDSEGLPNQRFSIPKESAAPKPEPTPSYRQEISNYADIEDTVAKALNWVSTSYKYVKEQPKRKRADTLRNIADEMFRVAKIRTELNSEESENIEDTRANYPSVAYFEAIKTITAGEKAVMLGNAEELPMEYEPLPGSDGYLEREGMRVAEEQNAVLAWALEKKDTSGEDMYKGIAKALHYGNRYGNQVLEMDWDYRIEERFVTEPIFAKPEVTEDGEEIVVEKQTKVIGRKFKKKKVTTANNPRLLVHDMADCQFDLNIPDVQDQNIFDIRKDMQLCNVYALQASGLLKNVGMIRGAEFNGEEASEKVKRETHNGGSGSTDNQTNLIEIHKTRIRLPINDDTGKWDEDNEIPHWYETWWAGDIETGSAICLAIMPNVHHCKKIPLMIMHAFEDNNGALHIGNPELLKPSYSMLTTIINQYFDNVSSRNQLPFIVERGSVGKQFMIVYAGGNRIIFKEPGFADPIPLEIKDTTQQTFIALDKAQDMLRQAGGINKPLLGEGLGSRASASEAINTLNQALKPALEDAKYKADQMLPFIGEWIMEMTRQFSDPAQQISVKFRGVERMVYPGRLYGEQIVRVVAIKKLQDSILRIQQEDTMMNQYIPAFRDLMTEEGLISLGKQIAKNRDFEEVDSWFKSGDDTDAKRSARSENQGILIDNITDFPTVGENHPVHITEHQDALIGYTMAVPEEEQNKEAIKKMKTHIKMHKRLQAERATVNPPQEAPAEDIAEEGAPRSVGEGAGDIIAGAQGAGAQTAETGRPPEAA